MRGIVKSGAADRCSSATINVGESRDGNREREEDLRLFEAFDTGCLLKALHGRVDEISRSVAGTNT